MTVLQKAVEAVHSVSRAKGDAFDIGDVTARTIAISVLMAIREPGREWFEAQEAFGLRPDDVVGSRYFIDAILNEEAA